MKWLKNLIAKIKASLQTPALSHESYEPIVSENRKTSDYSGLISFAIQSKDKMPERGGYPWGWPKGLVVHFTAGRRGGLVKALDSIRGGIKNGFTYLVIADTGELVQAHDIRQYGYHAGESKWPNLRSSVHKDLAGVEMNCAGKLENKNGKLMTWFNTEVKKENARYVTIHNWGCPTGWYEKYTHEQEETLIRLCLWLKRNDPTGRFSFDLVVGHHEVSGPAGMGKGKSFRKSDPGGSLSMPMPQFRQLLKSRWEMESRV